MKYSINFYLIPQPSKGKISSDSKKYLISAKLSWSGVNLLLGTGVMTEGKYWCKREQRFWLKQKRDKDFANKENLEYAVRKDAEEKNQKLIEFKSKIEGLFKRYDLVDIIPTREQLKKDININVRPSKNVETKKTFTFFDYYDKFMSDTEKNIRTTIHDGHIKKSTQKAYKTLKNHLLAFKPKLTFLDIDDKNFKTKFLSYLRNDVITNKGKKGLSEDTCNHQLNILKAFMNYAFEQEWISSLKFKKNLSKLKVESNPRVFLNKDEIKALWNFKTDDTRLKIARKSFLFLIFTGMRYSDFARFEKDKINLHDKCYKYIQEKTRQIAYAPYSIFFDKIIQEVDDKFWLTKKGNNTYSVISNQKLNDAIKDLCFHAGINDNEYKFRFMAAKVEEELHPKYKLISCHTARHSFISLLSDEFNLADRDWKILSGHSQGNEAYETYIHKNKNKVII